MPAHIRTSFAILAVTPLLLGCQYNPYAHLFTTTQPKQEHVAGSYSLTQQTIAPGGLSLLQGQRCVLELRGDGTFSIMNYPTWSEAFSPTNGQLVASISATGRWSCDTVGVVSDGRKSQRYWGVQFSDADTQLDPLTLTGKTPPYGLIMTYGDPDSGTVMIFEKK
ncbi:MAG: hypothetical protein J5I99_10760 [Verrucomicrobia bacterium]|nr:hypothetical protein [Kiritimatiellia bacterium]MCO6401690.1 hypothetical protein [Verrucomicrobiota bacterium]